MTSPEKIKILLFDNNFFYHAHFYKKLEAKEVEIIRLFDLEEMASIDSSDIRGLIAHPGIENQKYLSQITAKHPKLKVVIVSNEPGAYETSSLDASVFNVANINGIYDYFSRR